MPMYPHARPIKLKFHAGGWRVYLFNSVGTTIVPAKEVVDEHNKYSAADLAYGTPRASHR